MANDVKIKMDELVSTANLKIRENGQPSKRSLVKLLVVDNGIPVGTVKKYLADRFGTEVSYQMVYNMARTQGFEPKGS